MSLISLIGLISLVVSQIRLSTDNSINDLYLHRMFRRLTIFTLHGNNNERINGKGS